MVHEVDYVLDVGEVLLHHLVGVFQDPFLLERVLLMTVLVDLVHVEEDVAVVEGLPRKGKPLIQVVYELDVESQG